MQPHGASLYKVTDRTVAISLAHVLFNKFLIPVNNFFHNGAQNTWKAPIKQYHLFCFYLTRHT
jgi:hypothetical protein